MTTKENHNTEPDASRVFRYQSFSIDPDGKVKVTSKPITDLGEPSAPRPRWFRTPGRAFAELDDSGLRIEVSDGTRRCFFDLREQLSRLDHAGADINFPGLRFSEADQKNIFQQFACALNEATEDHFGVSHLEFLKSLSDLREGEFVDWQPVAPAKPVPRLEAASSLIAEDVDLPEEIVDGLIHRDTKVVLGGGSKAGKTMIFLDLSVSVATGRDFWHLKTARGRVVYMNFEIDRRFMRKRIECICEARGIPFEDLTDLRLWNLRGVNKSLTDLLPELEPQISHDKPSLVVIDPIYKSLGDRDENSARDIAKLCVEIENISVMAGATVAYAAHYSKGNQSGKEAIDRISGSGVFARDADSIINLTRHREPSCYTVETTLRNLPALQPFVVEWQYPLMSARPDLRPEDLKQAREPKKAAEVNVETLKSHVPETGAVDKDILISRLNKAGVGIVRAKSIITGWVAEGFAHRWETPRKKTRASVSYGRTPQPEPEETRCE